MALYRAFKHHLSFFFFTTWLLAGYELSNMTLAAGMGISMVLHKKAIVTYKVDYFVHLPWL